MPEHDSDLIGLLRETLTAQNKAIVDGFGELKEELKVIRKQVILVVLVALILMAGLVGVGVRWGNFSTTARTADPVSIVRPVTAPFVETLAGRSAEASTDTTAVAPIPSYGYPEPIDAQE